MTTDPNGTASQGPSTEEIEADIARTRAELAHTVDELTARFDVKARMQERVQALRDRATDDEGRPTPATLGAGGVAVAVLVGIVAVAIWRRSR